MLIATNANFSLENNCLKICNNTNFIKFFKSGKIEISCDDEKSAAEFLFEAMFSDNFMNPSLKNIDSTIIIYNCIIINAYEGSIKYIGDYYKEMPLWLQLLQDKLQRTKHLRAFL